MADWALNVVFTGLIAFVPVKTGKPCKPDCPTPDSVEVLMVDARASVNAGDQVPIASHMPALIYDPLQLHSSRVPDLRFYVAGCVNGMVDWIERNAVFLDGYRLDLPGNDELSWDVGANTINLNSASGQHDKIAIEPSCLTKGCPALTAAHLHVTKGAFYDDHKQGFEVTFFRRNVLNDAPVEYPSGYPYRVDAAEDMKLEVKAGDTDVIKGVPRSGSGKVSFTLAHKTDSPLMVVANLPLASILELRQPLAHHPKQPMRDFEWLYRLFETEPARKPVPHPSPWDPAPPVPTYEVPPIGTTCEGAGELHPRCPISQFP